MVTLAQRLAEINQAPPKPDIPGQQEQQEQQAPKETAPSPLPNLSSPSPSMNTPRTPRTPIRAANSPTHCANTEDQGLQVPTSTGTYTKFSYTTRRMTSFVMIRMIVHSAVTNQDIELQWETPRKLQVSVAWPEWFL